MKKKFINILLALAIGTFGVIVLKDSVPSVAADPVLAFNADFSTPGDFYNRFDYGLSGQSPAGRDDPNVAGAGGVFPAHGDHNMNCGPPVYGDPSTQRDVSIAGETWDNGNHFPNITFDQLFWYCAPGGDPAKGHMMTGFTTTGYNHLWFSPKQEYTGITKVCWDQNMNTIGGKWLELQFVDHADATRYPTGSHPADSVVARGTGGFDLGYTEPGFRPEVDGQVVPGPNNGLMPRSGNLAGLHIGVGGTIFDWWQNQNDEMATQVGWPGMLPNQGGNPSVADSPALQDKATRYKHCIENADSSHVKISYVSPEFPTQGHHLGDVVSYIVPGQIPQDSRRVVFHDSEYDGPKRGDYDPMNITWHWDNIQIFTANGVPDPTTTTTVPASTTTVPVSTTTIPASSTTLPASSTTVAPSSTVTTLPPTTTTVKPVTTTATTVPVTTTTVLAQIFKFPVYTTDPANPQIGQAWINSTTNQVKVKLPNGNIRVL